jgi:hypothetical protein
MDPKVRELTTLALLSAFLSGVAAILEYPLPAVVFAVLTGMAVSLARR